MLFSLKPALPTPICAALFPPAAWLLLALRGEDLVGEGLPCRLCDHDEFAVHGLVAGVAAIAELAERIHELALVLCLDRVIECLHGRGQRRDIGHGKAGI